MDHVTIGGWNVGFNPVAFNHLLRSSSSFSLREAKQIVDRILQGETLGIDVADGSLFCENATKLGAKCVFQKRPESPAPEIHNPT